MKQISRKQKYLKNDFIDTPNHELTIMADIHVWTSIITDGKRETYDPTLLRSEFKIKMAQKGYTHEDKVYYDYSPEIPAELARILATLKEAPRLWRDVVVNNIYKDEDTRYLDATYQMSLELHLPPYECAERIIAELISAHPGSLQCVMNCWALKKHWDRVRPEFKCQIHIGAFGFKAVKLRHNEKYIQGSKKCGKKKSKKQIGYFGNNKDKTVQFLWGNDHGAYVPDPHLKQNNSWHKTLLHQYHDVEKYFNGQEELAVEAKEYIEKHKPPLEHFITSKSKKLSY